MSASSSWSSEWHEIDAVHMKAADFFPILILPIFSHDYG